jgi:hypothetical protein
MVLVTSEVRQEPCNIIAHFHLKTEEPENVLIMATWIESLDVNSKKVTIGKMEARIVQMRDTLFARLKVIR